MSKLNKSQRVAQQVKNFLNDVEGYKRGDSHTLSETVIEKNDEGLITATINGKRFLLMETCTRDTHEGFMLLNALVIKHLNALKDIMDWQFELHWKNRKPYIMDKWNNHVELKTDENYNIEDLIGLSH